MPTFSTITTEEIGAAIRYFAALPYPFQVEAMKRQTEEVRASRLPVKERTPETYLKCLALAALSVREQEFAKHRKHLLTAQEAVEIERLRRLRVMKTKQKSSPKASRLAVQYAGLVEKLRGEGLGWGKISEYLAKYHKFKVSRSYLQRYFNDL